MDRPRVSWACGRVRVPELGLHECAAGVVEAAGVFYGCGIVAAQRDVGGTGGERLRSNCEHGKAKGCLEHHIVDSGRSIDCW